MSRREERSRETGAGTFGFGGAAKYSCEPVRKALMIEMRSPMPSVCVAIPTISSEISAVEHQLWLFGQPAFTPFLRPPSAEKRPALAYIFNNRGCEPIEALVRRIFAQSPALRDAFDGPLFHYLDLKGERNIYERNYSRPAGAGGYKAGPNNQFFGAMRALRDASRYALMIETDCIPIRNDWLGEISRQLLHSEPIWVMGGLYRGLGTLNRQFKRHLNGNAVYAVGDPLFQAFLDEVWEPRLASLVAQEDPRLAYDCAIELLFERADTMIRDNPEWRMMQSVAHKFRHSGFIQNRSAKLDGIFTPPDLVRQITAQSPEAYFLHGKIFADAVVSMRRNLRRPHPDNMLLHTYGTPVYEQSPAPRVLVIDMTAIGDGTATGEVKRALLEDWPDDRLMQVYRTSSGIGIYDPNPIAQRNVADMAGIREAIDRFQPDVVLYRPVPDTASLHTMAMELAASGIPFVTWIMDDWPEALALRDPAQFDALDADLRHLLQTSVVRLSICTRMSDALTERYGCAFVPVANGIDPADWPERAERGTEGTPFLIRYAGGLASNMGLASIVRVAHAIETLAAEGHDLRFEVRTQAHWLGVAQAAFGRFASTSIVIDSLSPADYRAWLSAADVLVIGYNFDPESLAYVRYSRANKLPECLASGAVLLAHGPSDVATIAELAELGCGSIVSEPDEAGLVDALRALMGDPSLRRRLSESAREIAFRDMNIRDSRARLGGALRHAAATRPPLQKIRPQRQPRAAGDGPRILLLGPDIPKDFDWPSIAGLATMIIDDVPRAPRGWRPSYFVGLSDPPLRSLHRIAAMFEGGELPRRCLVGEALSARLGSIVSERQSVTIGALRAIFPALRANPVTSLGHGALWAAEMGFGEVVIAGCPIAADGATDEDVGTAWLAVVAKLEAAGVTVKFLPAPYADLSWLAGRRHDAPTRPFSSHRLTASA